MRTLTAALAGAALATIVTGGAMIAGVQAQPTRHQDTVFRNHHMPYWTQRDCRSADDMNCFARDPGDGGRHPHFRELLGGPRNGLLCVHFAGTRQYAVNHDYCIQR